MFSSHVKGSSVEGAPQASPQDPPVVPKVSRAERKSVKEAEQAAAKIAAKAAETAERATQAATRKAAEEALKADKAATKEAKAAAKKAKKLPPPKEPLKPKDPPKPKAPLTAKKIIKTPDQLDPFDPNYDPLWKPPKPGVDFGLSCLALGSVAFVLSWVPIVRYVGAMFAVGGLVVAAVESRRASDRGKDLARAGQVGRFLAVVALIVVVLTTMMGFKESSDNSKKASGRATGMVLDDDLSVKFGKFVRGTNQFGEPTKMLPIVVRNKADGNRSFDFQVDALNPAGERIASQQLLVRNMREGEEREYSLFEYVDEPAAEALGTAKYKVPAAKAWK